MAARNIHGSDGGDAEISLQPANRRPYTQSCRTFSAQDNTRSVIPKIVAIDDMGSDFFDLFSRLFTIDADPDTFDCFKHWSPSIHQY